MRCYGGIPKSMILEATANIPTTAHILGGVVIGKDASSGVIDSKQQAFGYHNLLVFDGSALPANPGVNPSPTITAMTDRAMTFIPEKFSPNDASAYQVRSHALKNVRYSTVTLFAGHWGPTGGVTQHWIVAVLD